MKLENITPPSISETNAGSGLAKLASKDWDQYSRHCRKRFNLVSEIFREKRNHFNNEDINVLDWGCAIGGVAILFEDKFNVAMHASDVDPHSMKWLSNTISKIDTEVLNPGKKLPYNNNTFQYIYGISVLTHIPPEFQEFYLSELKRIASLNAVVVLTVQSYFACIYNEEKNRNIKVHPRNTEELKELGIIYKSYPDHVLNSMDFSKNSDYGLTYVSREYIEEVYGKYFDILEIREGAVGFQDVIIMSPKQD